MSDRYREAAHLVRRTSLGVFAKRITEVADLLEDSWDKAVAAIMDKGAQRVANYSEPPIFGEDDDEEIGRWWIDQLIDQDNGIAERMTWFWHTVLTTSINQVDPVLIAKQVHLLRSHSLGNFRDLLQGFVIDGALLQFLNGDGSQAFNPNENLGRELMELFTIGRGNYTQDDVRVAARALAGWVVEDDAVRFDTAAAFNSPTIFRGEQADWSTRSIVDALCDDPLTAINISSKLWTELVGTERSSDQVQELGLWWHAQKLDISSLVERILKTEEMRGSERSRPRTGFEWWAGVVTATGADSSNLWDLFTLGQLPYHPPNVGGWGHGDRWLSPGSMLSRSLMVFDFDDFDSASDRSDSANAAPWSTERILQECGLYGLSPQTLDVLDQAGRGRDLDAESISRLRWRIALSSPEFNYL